MSSGFDDSGGFDDGGGVDALTQRGRDWPCLRQFSVFLENRIGSLHELMRDLERREVRVVALSIQDSVDFAVLRLMVDNYEHGKELLDLSGFSYIETDVIGVELPDSPQPFVALCLTLLQAEVSINYSYPLLYRRHGKGAIALHVDDVEFALKTLSDARHRIITEGDLMDDDEFLG